MNFVQILTRFKHTLSMPFLFWAMSFRLERNNYMHTTLVVVGDYSHELSWREAGKRSGAFPRWRGVHVSVMHVRQRSAGRPSFLGARRGSRKGDEPPPPAPGRRHRRLCSRNFPARSCHLHSFQLFLSIPLSSCAESYWSPCWSSLFSVAKKS